MKTILAAYADIESPSHTIFQVEDDDPIVTFCKSWEAHGKQAWIDCGNDDDHLIEMAERIHEIKNYAPLPCTIDHVLHLAVY